MSYGERKDCLIFGAGEYDNIEPRLSEADLIIAADGGYSWLRERGIRPDLLVGDLDSLGYVPEGVDLLRLRPEKDDTDMAIAIAEGEARGCGRFIMYGGLGGRLDHTYANIQLAAGLSRQGKQAFILSGGCCIRRYTRVERLSSQATVAIYLYSRLGVKPAAYLRGDLNTALMTPLCMTTGRWVSAMSLQARRHL